MLVATKPNTASLMHFMIPRIDKTPQLCPLVCWGTRIWHLCLLPASFLIQFGPPFPHLTPPSMVFVMHSRNDVSHCVAHYAG